MSDAQRGKTFYLETFGCQMNVLDSQLVEGQLRARGWEQLRDHQDAEIILFNTCSVRQHAEDKVLSRLGQLKHVKRRRPDLIVGVIGCMAEREKDDLFVKAPVVDLLCGPGELNRLPTLLDEALERQGNVTALAGSLSRRTEVLERALEYDSLEALDLSRAPADDEPVLQSYIRVQRGCDKFCTYCVVPFTRGAERSRPPGHIVHEAEMLAARGCREITLLGQTVNSYVHQEEGDPVPFAKLLERVHEVEGIDRIRFVTSFPADWDEDIFRVMRDYPKLCPYLHIPAQSGSDAVLQRMRRPYTATSYLKLMETARKYIPDIALAGDFIVGFCGETDAEFAETVKLVREVEYKQIFVFKYSTRPGTAAERRQADDIPQSVKAQRNQELLQVQMDIMQRQKQLLVGQSVEVLVEGYSKYAKRAQKQTAEDAAKLMPSEQERGADVAKQSGSDSGTGANDPTRQLTGRTPHDVITVFNADEDLIGSIARVKVVDASPLTLFGELESITSTRRPARAAAAVTDEGTSLPILS